MGNEESYYNYDDFGGYGGYGGFDDGVNRRNWADVSQAALRREKKAKETFATIKKEWESILQEGVRLPPGSRHVIPLLNPTEHLVEKVWSRFHKQIKKVKDSHTGMAGCWDLKRRVATPEERKTFHITRKSKVYFVDAIFKVPKTTKKKQQSAGSQSSITSFVKKQAQDDSASVAAQGNAKRSALSMTSPPSEQAGPGVSSKKPRLAESTNTNNAAAPFVTPGTVSKTNMVAQQKRQQSLQSKTK